MLLQVRGAPAIAIVGCLSLAVQINEEKFESKKALRQEIEGRLNYLVSSRPTAVNMKLAADDLIQFANILCDDESLTIETMKQRFITRIEDMLDRDIADNKAIGMYGEKEIISQYPKENQFRILTHCNTGSLATAGYGTALGVIRTLQSSQKLGKQGLPTSE